MRLPVTHATLCLSMIALLASASPLAVAQPAATPVVAAAGDWSQALAAVTLRPDDIGLRRRVHGPVLQSLAPQAAGDPIRVVLCEQPMVVALFPIDVARAAVAAGRAPKVGGHIGVAGVIGEHKGELQVTVASADDVALLDAAQFPAPIAGQAPVRVEPTVTVAQVADHVGERVTVTAPIAEYKAPWNERAPHTLAINDGTAKVDVVFWSDMAGQIDLASLKPGAKATATGMAQLYKERLQLRLDAPDKLLVDGKAVGKASVAAGAPPATPSAPAPRTDGTSPISAAAGMLDQPITIVATVKGVRDAWSEKAPNIVTVVDDSGTIDVVYWSQVKDKLAPGLAAEGSRLRISGVVNQHNGRTQIKVTDAAKIEAAK